MSEKKKEVIALLDQIPEDKVDFVIEYIRQMTIQANDKNGLSPKMQAFQRLEALRK